MTTDNDNRDDDRSTDPPRYSYRSRSDEQSRDSRSPLERLIPELVRRGIEAGRGTLKQTDEALRNVSDSAFAKELVSHFFAQFGDIRQILSRSVAKEIGRVLEEQDIATEVRKVLKGMSVEATFKIDFPEQRAEDEKEEKDVER